MKLTAQADLFRDDWALTVSGRSATAAIAHITPVRVIVSDQLAVDLGQSATCSLKVSRDFHLPLGHISIRSREQGYHWVVRLALVLNSVHNPIRRQIISMT
jgi:hypothetical protein